MQPPGLMYRPLHRHLTSLIGDSWHATFEEVEAILGAPLPRSARNHRPWWANGGHSQARAWLAAGWKTANVNLSAGELDFVRSEAGVGNVAAQSGPIDARGASPNHVAGESQADRIRAFAAERYVVPARLAGEDVVVISAGDVGRLMGLTSHMPNVCSALGGSKFEGLANVTLVDRAGPAASTTTAFMFSINMASTRKPADPPLRGGYAATQLGVRPQRAPGPPRQEPARTSSLPPRTAVVFPCAGRKAANAGRFRMSDGRVVFFVADPTLAPADSSVLYRHPDDDAMGDRTFRQVLDDYNLQFKDENPWGLQPAWRLYSDRVYGGLKRAVGAANLFILSAGWGLIRADYLTPDYDVTFSNGKNVEAYKRRRKRDRYEDFQHLPAGGFDRVVFAGGKDYVKPFLMFTEGLGMERVVYYNSNLAASEHDARFVPFETHRKTNWHYEWADGLIAGEIRVT